MRTELKPGEEFVLIGRKHLFSLVPSAFVLLIFIILSNILCEHIHSREICGFFKMINVIAFLYFIWKIIARFFHNIAVTNFRLIYERGVFVTNSEECPLDKINKTALHQSFFGRIFGYGEIEIQSAATFGAIYYKFLQSPSYFKNVLIRYQELDRQLRVAEQAEALAKSIRSGLGIETGVGIGVGIGVNRNHDTRECPYCAEIIKAKAKVCRFCNNKLVPMMEDPFTYTYHTRQDAEKNHTGNKKNRVHDVKSSESNICKCGHRNNPEDIFCVECGESIK